MMEYNADFSARETQCFLSQEDPLLLVSRKEQVRPADEMPLGLAIRSSKGFITCVVCTTAFTDTFLYSMIIPILPDTLTKRAGVPREDVQWWISALLGVFGAASLVTSSVAGYLIDRAATRRTPLLLGLYVLVASTSLFCFSTSPILLVGARALQGSSATIVWVTALALVSDTMGASTSGTAMGWMAVGRFFGLIFGPALTGLLFELFGHFAVFGFAYFVLFVDLVLRIFMIERKVASQWLIVPDSGYGSIWSDSTSNGSNSPYDTESTGPDSRDEIVLDSSTDPDTCDSEIPSTLQLLKNYRVLMALWATFLCSVVMTALESVLPLYIMETFSWTPAQSGLIFISLAFSVVLDPYLGHLTDRHGPRVMTLFGLIIGTGIWIGFCAVTKNTATDKNLAIILVLILGFSIGLIATPNTVEISLAIDAMNHDTAGGFDTAKVMGLGYSFAAMAYGIGSVVGPFWGGLVIESKGWGPLCVSLAMLNLVTVIFAYFFSGAQTSKAERL